MKKNLILCILLNLVLLANTLEAQQKVSVKVYPELKRQKIKSIGGNYCQNRLTNNAWDPIGEETLKQFKPSNVRVALPLKFRNEIYSNFKGEKITAQPLVINLLESVKRMKYEFGVKSFIVSVWDVADDLVEDPAKRAQRIIKPDSYDELLDMIVAFLVKAKKDYGVEIDYFSFNESDGGWQLLFSPNATIAFIKKAMARFEAAGLKTRFLLADTAQTMGTVEYATMVMADSSIWKCLGPLCFHSWWSEKVPDSEFERVAAFAKAQNKPVWCDELGFDAMAHKVKGMFQTWDYALRLSRIAHRMLKYAEAEVSMYWTWQNDYSIMSYDLKTMFPSYYVTRHLVDYLNTGTQIVHSISSDPDILAISGIHENGMHVVQLINMKKLPVTVDIDGYDSKSVDMISTTESNNWLEQKNITKSKKGITQVKLMPESINTIILN